MDQKKCTKCGEVKSLELFPVNKKSKSGRKAKCKDCTNAERRKHRKLIGNTDNKLYEKTFKGFLMRTYRNMESRVTGVQKKKAHLYLGLELLPRDEFYSWASADRDLAELWDVWVLSGYQRKLTPSVDRKDSSKGYILDNMRWLTHSENSRLGNLSRYSK
jgi:hypothetical protein